MQSNRLRNSALAAVVLVLGLLIQRGFGLPFQLQFRESALNYWAVAVAFAMVPALVWWISRSLGPPWQRRLDIATIILFFPFLCVVIGSLLAAPTPGQIDETNLLISQSLTNGPAYRLYRTNCGTACSIGLVLKEEWDLPGGLKLVTPLWSRYRVDDGRVEIGRASIRVIAGGEVVGEVAR
jgi:hypothetical protein